MAGRREGEGQTALITGASGGIGLELARQFATGGYDLVLVARSAGALERIATEFSREFHVRAVPIGCDLSRPQAAGELAETLAKHPVDIDVLVNNAGYGAVGPFDGSAAREQLGIVDVNVRAVVELTHVFWPDMLRRKRGGVLNVASLAAFQPGPFMAVYCASKAFVLSFTEALWEEARGTGLRVSCLCPGTTQSGFHRRAGTEKLRLLRGGLMPADKVAQLGYRAFLANRRVKVTGVANNLVSYVTPVSPRPLVLGVARRLLSA